MQTYIHAHIQTDGFQKPVFRNWEWSSNSVNLIKALDRFLKASVLSHTYMVKQEVLSANYTKKVKLSL
jgi:hypothetical protein